MVRRRKKSVSVVSSLVLLALASVGGWWWSDKDETSLPARSERTEQNPAPNKGSPAAPAAASTEEFLVLSCNDGDTCRVRSASNATLRIRLVGVDAPEMAKKKKNQEAQPMGLQAKEFLNENLKGRMVKVRFFGTDPFDRNLGEILLSGDSMNLRLIRQGYAEVYRGKPPSGLDLDPFLQAETEAKKEKRGIWGIAGYQSPKDFRKKNK